MTNLIIVLQASIKSYVYQVNIILKDLSYVLLIVLLDCLKQNIPTREQQTLWQNRLINEMFSIMQQIFKVFFIYLNYLGFFKVIS